MLILSVQTFMSIVLMRWTKTYGVSRLAVIEFVNTETQQALEQFSPYYKQPTIKAITQKLPTLPPKIAYQKFKSGKAVYTVITME
jgi:hypothetical protein